MYLALFAADSTDPKQIGIVIGAIVLLFIGLVGLVIFFTFIHLWIQSLLYGARIGFSQLIRMRLGKVDYAMIVRQKVALVQAGVKVTTEELESHYQSRGNVPRTATAVIAAHKAGMDMPWKTAAAIDLAGRDVLDAVKTSVNPKVIDCPDPTKGRQFLDAVCRNGIQLRAKARVTVRTKLERLVGGATEETIIARVGEGIVKAIGSAHDHREVLANPNQITQTVLHSSLDSQTAFEIVSVDMADIEVGENIGATLQARQADADLQVARAEAEKRRAAAVAREQEMQALVAENRAKVVLAEAEVPLAIAQAFRDGRIGVMDYYNLKNLQADTDMRSSISGAKPNSDRAS
ncbi:MAG: flotillin-like protein FloA [Gemmataceae bacterium]